MIPRVPIRAHTIRLLRRTGRIDRAVEIRQHYRETRDDRVRQLRLKATSKQFRAVASADPDVMITTTGSYRQRSRAVLARRRASPVVAASIVANRALVIEVLDAHGIAHEAIPIDTPNRVRIGVADGARDRLMTWLQQSTPPTTYIYFDTSTITRRQRIQHLASTPLERLQRLGRAGWVWRVYEYRTDRSGVDVLDDLHGCEIEFWRINEELTELTPSRWNSHVSRVSSQDFGQSARSTAIPPRFIDQIDFPIDIVYTWVDGDDPAWQRRRDATLGLLPPTELHHEASNTARYESRDELRYSLRSVEKFADFVRHVYVVTDDQHPTWLRDDLANLRVVSHREIFADPSDLPTFNSHSIESRLHHIPGLAEHYIYLNDDFFLARRVLGTRFFHGNGLAKFFFSRALIPRGTPTVRNKPVDSAAMNGRRLVQGAYGVSPTQKFKHAPYPQLRSVNEEVERKFTSELATTTGSRVRSPTDLALASSLHHHVAYVTGRATPGLIATSYVDLGQPNLEGRLYSLLQRRDVDSFCLNDAESETITAQRKVELVHQFLEAYFPEKSGFER